MPIETSHFSPHALSERHHRALLLQFVIYELIAAHKAFLNDENVYSPHPRFFPYDWATQARPLNKVYEHALLMKRSFADHPKPMAKWEKTFVKLTESSSEKFTLALRAVFEALEPLMLACKEDENLVFFLLKHRVVIDGILQEGYVRNFLLAAHPSGLESLGEKMCDKYHQRGFFAQIPEFKLLITELIHV
jgi:hypothetical protein